jgi:hypothetical protein
MADNEGKAASGPESNRKPKTEAPKTKAYVLKPGVSMNTIEGGEHVTRMGNEDGTVSVHLTDVQAENFADKLDLGKTPNESNVKDPSSVLIGVETGGAPTIAEGAALAAKEAGLTGDSEEDEDGDATNDRPAGPHRLEKASGETKAAAKAPAEGKAEGEGKPADKGAGQAGAAPAAGTAAAKA